MGLRKICWSRRNAVTAEMRRMHNEELFDVYFPPDIIWMIKSRKMRYDGHVARMEERRGAYRILLWRPEGNRQL
jgi:hypothetical protein